jgi:hypothetical protein
MVYTSASWSKTLLSEMFFESDCVCGIEVFSFLSVTPVYAHVEALDHRLFHQSKQVFIPAVKPFIVHQKLQNTVDTC